MIFIFENIHLMREFCEIWEVCEATYKDYN